MAARTVGIGLRENRPGGGGPAGGAPRLVRFLGAVCAVLLVAGALAVLIRPSPVAAGSNRRAAYLAPTVTTTVAIIPTTTAVVPATTAPRPTTTTPAPPPGPGHRWGVGVASATFVDTGRPTPAGGGAPASPSRTLPTEIRYPSTGPVSGDDVTLAPASPVGAPFPLIVFGHGYDVTPDTYAALLHYWAAAGYVVASPVFPRAAAGGPLDETDVDHEPGDLAFVAARMVATYPGLVDASRVAAAGQSDGGVAALGAAYNTCCRYPAFRAVAALSGDEHDFPGGQWWTAPGPPLLVVQGDHDPYNDLSLGQQVFDHARTPKWFLVLLGAGHLEPFTSDLAHLGVVEAATLGFLDRYLRGWPDGTARLRASPVAGLASLASG